MSTLRGVIVGSLGLALMYDIVAPIDKQGHTPPGVTTLTGIPGKVANYLISPAVPLIPDLRSGSKVTAGANGKLQFSGTLPPGSGLAIPGPAGSVAGSLLGISYQPTAPAAPPPSSSTPAGGILV